MFFGTMLFTQMLSSIATAIVATSGALDISRLREVFPASKKDPSVVLVAEAQANTEFSHTCAYKQVVVGMIAARVSKKIGDSKERKQQVGNEKTVAEFIRFGVLPQARRMGIGAKLLSELAKHCSEHKVDEFVIQTSSLAMAGAFSQKFMEKRGVGPPKASNPFGFFAALAFLVFGIKGYFYTGTPSQLCTNDET
mmetsp:Transcript_44221/g.114910  ORF Transcript_44221/g.114910 Transcript_44221/m.114910 type:complete len:195 (-) Transcript_44221:534-1118(-)